MIELACIRFFRACISALALSTADRMLALSAARREALCCSSVSSRFRARVAEEEGESLPAVSPPLLPESKRGECSVIYSIRLNGKTYENFDSSVPQHFLLWYLYDI